MPVLNIAGKKVTVGDEFLKLTPEQQNAAVDEIAGSLGMLGNNGPSPPASEAYADPMGATIPQVRPAQAGMPYGEQLAKIGGVIDKGVRLAANGATFGLADKFAGGMDALTGQAPSYDAGVRAQREQTQAIRDESPIAAGAAELAGGALSGVGLMRNGLTLMGRAGPGIGSRILGYGAEGAAYGAAHGAGNTYSDDATQYIQNATGGAALGGGLGLALPAAGALAGGIYRGGAAFLGPSVGGAGRGASAMLRTAAQADQSGLRRLAQMGPDAMLPDAGPSMLGLAQGAGTGTGPGRSLLTNALAARDAATGPRIAATLDQNLGPAPIPSAVEAQLAGARTEVGRQYDPVIRNAMAVDTTPLAHELEAQAINLRGPAQQAVLRVRQMLDIPGAPGTLDPHPGAMLSTRQAIDGMIGAENNPQVIRELTAARNFVDEELARAAPGIKAVDAQYQELASQSEGLRRGSQIFDAGKTAIRPAELTQEMIQSAAPKGVGLGPSAESAMLRQGARAEIDRLVGTNVNDLNALERKLGTPQDWNAQKLAIVFGDEPAGRVAAALMHNRQFRDTYQKVVQNSQTAQRMEAASAIGGSEGGNIPHDPTVLGVGMRALNLVARAVSKGSGAKTRDDIGRTLAVQGPAVQAMVQELLHSAQVAAANHQSIAALVSQPRLISATAPFVGRQESQR